MSAPYWRAQGLSERAARGLETLGVTDAEGVAAWVAANSEGDGVIGRVLRAELFNWLSERGLLRNPEDSGFTDAERSALFRAHRLSSSP